MTEYNGHNYPLVARMEADGRYHELAEDKRIEYLKDSGQENKIRPKIYVFSGMASGSDEGVCYAIAEDGTILGEHYCSNEHFAPWDLGVTNPKSRRHEEYLEYYKKGYDMEFVEANRRDAHLGLQEAIKRAKERE